jgi:hypothetical protein
VGRGAGDEHGKSTYDAATAALRAAERGEVKRYYDGNSDVLTTAPFSGGAALKAKSIIA